MKGKCTVSVGIKGKGEFRKGVVYDVDDLPPDVVKAYFETPEISPAKKQTRTKADSGKDG